MRKWDIRRWEEGKQEEEEEEEEEDSRVFNANGTEGIIFVFVTPRSIVVYSPGKPIPMGSCALGCMGKPANGKAGWVRPWWVRGKVAAERALWVSKSSSNILQLVAEPADMDDIVDDGCRKDNISLSMGRGRSSFSQLQFHMFSDVLLRTEPKVGSCVSLESASPLSVSVIPALRPKLWFYFHLTKYGSS